MRPCFQSGVFSVRCKCLRALHGLTAAIGRPCSGGKPGTILGPANYPRGPASIPPPPTPAWSAYSEAQSAITPIAPSKRFPWSVLPALARKHAPARAPFAPRAFAPRPAVGLLFVGSGGDPLPIGPAVAVPIPATFVFAPNKMLVCAPPPCVRMNDHGGIGRIFVRLMCVPTSVAAADNRSGRTYPGESQNSYTNQRDENGFSECCHVNTLFGGFQSSVNGKR